MSNTTLRRALIAGAAGLLALLTACGSAGSDSKVSTVDPAAITVASLWSGRTGEQQRVVCDAYNADPQGTLAAIDAGGVQGGGTSEEVTALHGAWDGLLSQDC